MTPVDIGSRLELWVDLHLADRFSGEITHRLHSPVARELITGIEDEEGRSYRYMTVFRDGDLYRMYYAFPKVVRIEGKKVKEPERIGYAESRDGIHWQKRQVGIFDMPGLKINSIVWMETGREQLGISGFSPFKDENPDCLPEQRYKAIAEAGPLGKELLGRNGLLALASPDGLHWSMIQPEPVMTGGPGLGAFDSQNLAFWDAERREYRLYRREVFREGPLNVLRDILTATSRDFLHWSEPVRLCYPSAVPEQLYTNNILPYERAPHLFLGFPVRYTERRWSEAIAALPETERRKALIRESGREPGEDDPTGSGGERIGTAITDTLFMSSRDGQTFHRWNEAFIRPGLRPKDNWFYPDNFPAWGLVSTPSAIDGAPDELSFYVSEGGRRKVPNQCRRHTLRVDGFASLNASRKGGEIVTRPLCFSGNQLVINFSASAAGGLRVELLNAEGKPIPGFELTDCVELLGDDLERRVQWQGAPDLSTLAGVPIRLRFAMTDADLFSFRFR